MKTKELALRTTPNKYLATFIHRYRLLTSLTFLYNRDWLSMNCMRYRGYRDTTNVELKAKILLQHHAENLNNKFNIKDPIGQGLWNNETTGIRKFALENSFCEKI